MIAGDVLTAEMRLQALETACGDGGRDAAIVGAMEDPTTVVRERAIALAARHLPPELQATILHHMVFCFSARGLMLSIPMPADDDGGTVIVILVPSACR